MDQSFNEPEVMERTLTVINYGYDDDEKRVIKTRITIAPEMIKTVVASYEPCRSADGMKQHRVNVLYTDGSQMELFITALDLSVLERVAGFYTMVR